MEIGEISEKIKRGKRTTRHSELFSLGDGIYIMDTPGFTSLGLPNLEKRNSGIIIRNLRSIKIAVSFWDVFTYMSHSAV